MGEYVDVAGHPTWLHRSGAGAEKVLLLHGGLSCSEELLAALVHPDGIDLVARLVRDFLAGPVPPATLLPVRRANAAR